MIGRLQGILIEIQAPLILIDVQGVGYEVQVPMTTLYQLPELGEPVCLTTHFAVSETAQTIFGFYCRPDRDLFRVLIRVNGVGPKLGLAILSGLEASQLVECVAKNDVVALTRVPGIGRKTAERLVVELRDRLGDWPFPQSPENPSPTGAGPTNENIANEIVADAESALVALGYKPVEAAKAIAAVHDSQTITRSEDLIRLALRSLVPV